MRFNSIFLALFFLGKHLIGQCDSEVLRNASSPYPYKFRGNYCEGFYGPKASAGGNLEVVACTWGDFNFKNQSGEAITLSSASTQPIFVLACGIPSTLYYRMDAKLAPNQSLEWDADAVLLKPRDPRTTKAVNIGLFGYYNGTFDKIYVPIRAQSKLLTNSDVSSKIVVKLRPLQPIKVVSCKFDQKSLESGSISKSTEVITITIALPKDREKSTYTLEVEYLPEQENETKISRFDIQIK